MYLVLGLCLMSHAFIASMKIERDMPRLDFRLLISVILAFWGGLSLLTYVALQALTEKVHG